MPSSKKIIVIASALVIITVTGRYFYNEYYRRPADILLLQTDATTNAAALIHAFESDEATANTIYLGKTIEVSGTVLQVVNQADTLLNIFLGEKDRPNKVSCLMDIVHFKTKESVKPGTMHIVKGICTGYLMDVELNRCIIIE
ncbi:MAG: hypothetical protein ABJA37_07500 [Ferruginibacter sp.]